MSSQSLIQIINRQLPSITDDASLSLMSELHNNFSKDAIHVFKKMLNYFDPDDIDFNFWEYYYLNSCDTNQEFIHDVIASAPYADILDDLVDKYIDYQKSAYDGTCFQWMQYTIGLLTNLPPYNQPEHQDKCRAILKEQGADQMFDVWNNLDDYEYDSYLKYLDQIYEENCDQTEKQHESNEPMQVQFHVQKIFKRDYKDHESKHINRHSWIDQLKHKGIEADVIAPHRLDDTLILNIRTLAATDRVMQAVHDRYDDLNNVIIPAMTVSVNHDTHIIHLTAKVIFK